MLYQTYREFVWAVCNVMSGTGVSNRAECQSKMTRNLDVLPRQWTMIMLRKCLLWFIKIITELFMKFAEELGICGSLCHLILTDTLKMRHVASKFVLCLLTDAQIENLVTQSAGVWSFECWWKLSEKFQNRWWNLGVRLRWWNKSSLFALDGKIVAVTKKKHVRVALMWRWWRYFVFLLEVYHS